MKTAKHLAPRLSSRALAMGILAAGLVACLALNWPGQLSYDSIAQLHDGHFGVYNGWHPPVMAFLLGISDRIIPGAGLFAAFDILLFFGCAALVLWLDARTNWAAPVAALAVVALPQVVLYQGIVWKDVLFADAAIAGFVLLAFAASRWQQRALRLASLFVGLVFLVLAALTRQNGPVALVFGLAAIGALAATQEENKRDVVAYATSALAVALILYVSASLALALRVPGESGALAQLKLLEFYDLIGALRDRPALDLDRIETANPDLAELMRDDGVRLYTPQRNDTLVQSAELQGELSGTSAGVIFSQWRDLVVNHPWEYLKVRGRVFTWVFLTPHIERCYPVYVGVGGLPTYMRDLHLAPRARPQDEWLRAYALRFVGTPVYSHLTFAILGLAELVFLLRRRSPSDLGLAFLLGAALAFASSFFVISIACDYRYLVFLDLSVLVAGLYIVAVRPKNRPNGDAQRSLG